MKRRTKNLLIILCYYHLQRIFLHVYRKPVSRFPSCSEYSYRKPVSCFPQQFSVMLTGCSSSACSNTFSWACLMWCTIYFQSPQIQSSFCRSSISCFGALVVSSFWPWPLMRCCNMSTNTFNILWFHGFSDMDKLFRSATIWIKNFLYTWCPCKPQ